MGEKTQIYSCFHNVVVLTSLVEIPCPHGCIQDTHTIHTATPILPSVSSIQAVAVRTHTGQQRTEPWPGSLAMRTGPSTQGRSFHMTGCKGVQLPSQGFVPEVPSPYCHHLAEGIHPCSLSWQTGCVIWKAITYLAISFR